MSNDYDIVKNVDEHGVEEVQIVMKGNKAPATPVKPTTPDVSPDDKKGNSK